ncbi:stressosome-associated protein Prli42 [Bacillus marinisedimentorum]|nr:stressosome-associated protein Prli42 [Bacillus marinisedimentorum]
MPQKGRKFIVMLMIISMLLSTVLMGISFFL